MKVIGREAFAKYTNAETFAKIKEYDTVNEMWKMCLENYSDDVAIIDGETNATFAQIESDAAAFRGVLGMSGKRVGILATNSYDFVKAYIAIVTSGNTAMILPPQLPAEAVFGCAMMYQLSAVVVEASLKEKTGVLASQNPAVNIIDIAAVGDATPMTDTTKAEDPCVIMFTGGTTGKSKGALLSHRAVMQGTVNGCYGYEEVFGQRYLVVLPFFHVFGLIRNLMTSLYTGSTLFICRNNKDMFRDVAMFRPTIMVMVPALAEMSLTLSKKFGKNMLGDSIKYIIAGAAAVAPYLVKEYDKLGVKLFPGYGLTESANLVSGNPESLEKPDSVGIPFPNQEFKIVNGELWIKGDNMMDGYIGVEEEAFENGYFKTGDLVRFDEDGFLYITGRIKEIIILANGENISPAEVEKHYNELEFVQDSQVFEDVDDNGTHFLALEVVLRETELVKLGDSDDKSYAMSELEKVNQSLPSHWRVNRIEIRDKDFERTPSMKIVRYKKC